MAGTAGILITVDRNSICCRSKSSRELFCALYFKSFKYTLDRYLWMSCDIFFYYLLAVVDKCS